MLGTSAFSINGGIVHANVFQNQHPPLSSRVCEQGKNISSFHFLLSHPSLQSWGSGIILVLLTDQEAETQRR